MFCELCVNKLISSKCMYCNNFKVSRTRVAASSIDSKLLAIGKGEAKSLLILHKLWLGLGSIERCFVQALLGMLECNKKPAAHKSCYSTQKGCKSQIK